MAQHGAMLLAAKALLQVPSPVVRWPSRSLSVTATFPLEFHVHCVEMCVSNVGYTCRNM